MLGLASSLLASSVWRVCLADELNMGVDRDNVNPLKTLDKFRSAQRICNEINRLADSFPSKINQIKCNKIQTFFDYRLKSIG